MRKHIVITFKKIYEETSGLIMKFCMLRVSNKEQAEDISQEAFLRLWQSLSIGKTIKNGKAYIFTITRRLIIDWYRKKKSVSLEEMSEGEFVNEVIDEKSMDNLSFGPESRLIWQKVNELTHTHKEILNLRFMMGLSPKEIGEKLGVSANAASVRISKALTALRKISGYQY